MTPILALKMTVRLKTKKELGKDAFGSRDGRQRC